MKKSLVLGLALLAGGTAQAAQIVDFEAFNIRNTSGTITPTWDANMSIVENQDGDGFAAMTPQGGQKVGYGTSAFDGFKLNELETVDWDKVSGAANVAYLNIWVTDGLGNYAIIASENNYVGTDFANRTEWKIFEFGPGPATPNNQSGYDFDWLFDSPNVGGRSSQYLTFNGSNATLADLSDNIVVASAPPGYPSSYVSTGAPRGGFGFNLIYGDTASNFVGAYHLENLTVDWNGETYAAGAVVPIPAAAPLGLLGMGLIGLISRRRKKSA